LSGRVVVWLLVGLAAAAGCLDAVCVTRLGGVFASVVTGNLVQLGTAVAALDGGMAARASAAVGGYAVGVAVGTVGLYRCTAGWRRCTNVAVAAEAVLLTGVAAGWQASDGRPGRAAAMLLLAAAGVAMGAQSVVTANSGVPGASTTYLTGTFTSVVRSLITGPHRLAGGAGGASRLVALLCGAAAGALLLRIAPLWAPALSAALVTLVVIVAALTRARMGES
jgi:uncharacterized membrane protein YoaK (UPF0700 family)